MKKLLLIIIITVLFVILYFSDHIEYIETDAHRGCVASAYQASSRGFDLETNLSHCD